jgi:hypothetical protein
VKKWLIIGLVIAVFLSLVARALFIRVGRGKTERQWYAKHLAFRFSASVDSLKVFSHTNGLVYFHAIHGEFNASSEDRLNQKLKFHGALRFALNIPKGTHAFHSRDLEKYRRGDSLAINSDIDSIYIYRQGKFAAASKISGALSGRPF